MREKYSKVEFVVDKVLIAWYLAIAINFTVIITLASQHPDFLVHVYFNDYHEGWLEVFLSYFFTILLIVRLIHIKIKYL